MKCCFRKICCDGATSILLRTHKQHVINLCVQQVIQTVNSPSKHTLLHKVQETGFEITVRKFFSLPVWFSLPQFVIFFLRFKIMFMYNCIMLKSDFIREMKLIFFSFLFTGLYLTFFLTKGFKTRTNRYPL